MRMSTYVSCITALLTLSIAPVLSNTVKYAGARQSDYGITPFPTVKEWGNVMRNMSANFSGASPVGIWIVGTLWGSSCALEFLYKGSVPNVIEKESTDKHEPFLKHFDTLGIKVFLQVEPGLAAVDSLIDIILRQYRHHPCVTGFGVDVEWYESSGSPNTTIEVTDATAQRWESKVKAHNTSYRLFLKHWEISMMPGTYRGGIVFVDDSQGFPNLDAMTTEFKAWADYFKPNAVFYQIGYNNTVGGYNDYNWWKTYANPPKTMGDAIAAKNTNSGQEIGITWVDFTLRYPELDLFKDPNVKQPPVITDIPDQKIVTGGSFTPVALDNYVSDADNLKSELVWSSSATSNITVSINSSRIAAIAVKNTSWIGSETVMFTVKDPDNQSASCQTVFTVASNTGNPPVVSGIPNQTISESQLFTPIALDTYVTDADNPDAEISWTTRGAVALTVTIGSDRVAAITKPNPEWSGSETITFIAQDPKGNRDSAQVIFTVNSINDPPVVSPIPNQTIISGQSFAPVKLDDFVADPDDPDSVIQWETSRTKRLNVSIAKRVATVVPNSNSWTGSETFDFVASDPHGQSARRTVTFTINEKPINHAPDNITLSSNTLRENDSGAVVGILTVSDQDSGDTHSLTTTDIRFEIASQQLKGKTGIAFDYESVKALSVKVTATDKGGLSLSKTFTIVILNQNEPPEAVILTNQTVKEKIIGAFVGKVSVKDPDSADLHTLTVSDPRFEIISDSLKLKNTVALDKAQTPSVSVTITATDKGGLKYSQAFTITVDATVGIMNPDNTHQAAVRYSVFPNPVVRSRGAAITLHCAAKNLASGSVTIYDASGNCIYTSQTISAPDAQAINTVWNLRIGRSQDIAASGTYVVVFKLKTITGATIIKRMMLGVKR